MAKTIQEQIGEHTKEIAAKTAERVAEIWQEFRRAHVKVLDLAERHDPSARSSTCKSPRTSPASTRWWRWCWRPTAGRASCGA
ncbi:MAG: hypothetical protein HOP09_10800 [Hyphomicrobium sp.]|nr:hypothetical protein [Hyphomicrobium sp.]